MNLWTETLFNCSMWLYLSVVRYKNYSEIIKNSISFIFYIGICYEWFFLNTAEKKNKFRHLDPIKMIYIYIKYLNR